MLEGEVMRASVIVTETFPDRFYCHNLLSRVQPHLIQFTSSFGRFFYGEFTDCWVGRCFISVLLTVVPLLATFAGCLACLPVTLPARDAVCGDLYCVHSNRFVSSLKHETRNPNL